LEIYSKDNANPSNGEAVQLILSLNGNGQEEEEEEEEGDGDDASSGDKLHRTRTKRTGTRPGLEGR
jgi:hypothetical protein